MKKETFHQYQVGDRLADRKGRKGTVRQVGPVDYLAVLFDNARFPENVTAGWTTPLDAFDQPAQETQEAYQARPRVQEEKYKQQVASLGLAASLRFRDFFRRRR